VCGICSQARRQLVSLATDGTLLQVCRLCFCCRELQASGCRLPRGEAYETLADGLEALYVLAREATHASRG
jgi:hypothetical protein